MAIGVEKTGGPGNDTLKGSPGDDTLLGAGGDDSIVAGDGSDSCDGGDGADRVVLLASGLDNVTLGDGDDQLVLQWKSSYRPGDLVSGGVYDGGEGSDRLVLKFGQSSVTYDRLVTFGNGALTFSEGGDTVYSATFSNFESIDLELNSSIIDVGDRVRISGLSGDDRIVTEQSATLRGFAGDDTLSVYDNAALLDGGRGDDTLSYDVKYDLQAAVATTLIGGAGHDYLEIDNTDGYSLTMAGDVGRSATLKSGDVLLAHIRGVERISITSGDRGDTLFGGSGDDYVYDGGGRNVIRTGAGNDEASLTLDAKLDDVDLGDGFDVLSIDDRSFNSDAVVMTGDLQTGAVMTLGGARAFKLAGVEQITLTTSGARDVLIGGLGDDRFETGGGGDEVRTGAGDDFVSSSIDQGSTYLLGDGDDTLALEYDGAKAFVLTSDATGSKYTLGGRASGEIQGVEHLSLSLEAGRYDITLGAGDDFVSLALDRSADSIDGGGGDDFLFLEGPYDQAMSMSETASGFAVTVGGRVALRGGSFEALEVVGSGKGDTLLGFDGDDRLFGGDGGDLLNGGGGADLLVSGSGKDTLDGGDGVDLASYEGISAKLTIRLADGSVFEGRKAGGAIRNVENVSGGEGDDLIVGDSGDNVVSGGLDGDDTLDGGAGVDTLVLEFDDRKDWDQSFELRLGGAKQTSLTTYYYDEYDDFFARTITVSNFENVVGADGADTIVGDRKDNRLDGGGGENSLTGGKGADTFAFSLDRSTGSYYGSDTITDFSTTQGDRLDLSGLGPDLFLGVARSFSGAAGEVVISQGAAATIVRADLDGDRAADAVITLRGAIDLSASDFIF